MNAQQKTLEYAKGKNNGTLTNQEFVGQMATEGVVIERTPNSKTIARLRREGKTIIVTETTVKNTNEVIGGKLVFGKSESTREIFRADL